MSASVKAYFALKMIGDSHRRRRTCAAPARRSCARGGAARTNVFTRMLLALYGVDPVARRAGDAGRDHAAAELVSVPPRQDFVLGRTVIVPLLVLLALKPQAKNREGRADRRAVPRAAGPGSASRQARRIRTWSWFAFFRGVDIVLRAIEPLFPNAAARQRAIETAVAFVTERLNGEDGLGAIFPAMVNSVMMFDVLGYPRRPSACRRSRGARSRSSGGQASTRPIASPACRRSGTPALAATRCSRSAATTLSRSVNKGLEWLKPLQILDVNGDWAAARPNVRPGGWAFQYANAHYPDLDDTAVVVMAMDRAQTCRATTLPASRSRARANGSSGCRARTAAGARSMPTTTYYYLNNIPFADHGALLDPPTEDVTARCVSMLAQLGDMPKNIPAHGAGARLSAPRRSIADGSWYGRWGMNYIYGTWSVLCALNAAGVDRSAPRNPQGGRLARRDPERGWRLGRGRHRATSSTISGYEPAPSTPSQTAWALLGLMAAGEIDHPAVARGIDYLSQTQGADGLWAEERFTATGFPRVFYLRYHGYAKFFPLWAMARYRNLKRANSPSVAYGM